MTSTIQRFEAASQRPAVSQATAIEQSRAVAEVQAAVIVAQNVPRDMQRAIAEMRESCGRMAMAEQAFYAVPNRGTGASVHLARELARIWGNIEHGSHELRREDDAGMSEVQAFAWDKQTNTRTSRTFIAPHERMKAGARQRLTDLGDIQNNNNNVAARAVRECILNVLPRWFTEEAQNICHNTLENGEGKPLSQRIDEMVGAFAGIGISQKQLEAKVEKKLGQFDASDVAQMGIVYTSITRDGISKNEAFPPIEETVAEIVGNDENNEPTKDASKLRGKVKSAVPDVEKADTETDKNAANNQSEQVKEPGKVDECVCREDGNHGDCEVHGYVAPPDTPDEHTEDADIAAAPGAPTADTPGQTDRVASALGNARKGSKARGAYMDLIAALFREAGLETLDDLPTVASSILKIRVQYAATLTDSQLKTVHTSLRAWKDVGTLPDMVTRILDAADMAAEQTTLDTE